jgi:beta-glucosidase
MIDHHRLPIPDPRSPIPAMTRFPPGFLWGAATAAYQIEGAVTEDGRGASIWDAYCRVPGAIEGGDTGEIAAGSYERWREDVALMAELGLRGYRFSTGWSRIMPDGVALNQRGLDFYDALVDALLAAGIAPLVTLNHWDMPQALQERGGWGSRATMERFVEYADVVTRRLGDRVTRWVTHNEPWVIAFLGHYYAQHAPGLRDATLALQVAHHLLVSHGMAVPVIRANSRDAEVGIVNVHFPNRPASDAQADVEAARRADAIDNRWFLDPLFRGSYPQEIVAWYGAAAPVVDPGDMALIATPIDFLGVNYYYRRVIAADRNEPLFSFRELPHESSAMTTMLWSEIDPSALGDFLVRLAREWDVPGIYITENGLPLIEAAEPARDGTIDDGPRIGYLSSHIDAVGNAITRGAPVRGYFVWCLLDTFEWNYGYRPRFGIVCVERPSLARVPKASAAWYRDLIGQSAG